MKDETKILIEYMRLSPNRQKVLKSFQGEVLRPTQIREKELIYLLNPDFHVGRLYDITEKGRFIVEFL